MAQMTMMTRGASPQGRDATVSARRQSASQNRIQSNFAALMRKENAGAASQPAAVGEPKNGQPKVEARPVLSAGIPLSRSPLQGRASADMFRGRNFNAAGRDIAASRAMESFIKAAGADGSGLDAARGMSAAENLRLMAAGGGGKGFALTGNDFIHTRNVERIARAGRKRAQETDAAQGIGKLSAKFESGGDGIAAIGYDGTGGTSYGKYQIASKVGSMSAFLTFLDKEAPDIAKTLRQAGPANTGGRGGAMPDAWRAIAKAQPERFERLQESFIHQSHYKPALDAIGQRTGIDIDSLSAAMREVIWSTAVQHGPAGAAKIFARADDMSGASQSADYERNMINNVYAVRAGQFGSSTSRVREAVRNRFRQERQIALKMLDGVRPELAALS